MIGLSLCLTEGHLVTWQGATLTWQRDSLWSCGLTGIPFYGAQKSALGRKDPLLPDAALLEPGRGPSWPNRLPLWPSRVHIWPDRGPSCCLTGIPLVVYRGPTTGATLVTWHGPHPIGPTGCPLDLTRDPLVAWQVFLLWPYWGLHCCLTVGPLER